MVPLLGRNLEKFIYNRFNQLLRSCNLEPRYFTAEPPGSILQCNSSPGIPTTKLPFVCWWNSFTNFSSNLNQKIVYNSHKRVQRIKFQSLALPNELIGNFSRPYEQKQYESTMLHGSGMLTNLQRPAWHNNQLFCIYGDPAYALSIHLGASISRQNLMPNFIPK